MRYTKKVAQRHIRPAHFHHGTIHACNNTKNRIRHRNSSALNNRIRDNKAENLNDANKKMFDAGENKLTGILDVIKNPYNKSGISVHKIESPYPKKHPMNKRKNIVLFNFSEIWIPYFFNEIKSKPMHENRKNPLY